MMLEIYLMINHHNITFNDIVSHLYSGLSQNAFLLILVARIVLFVISPSMWYLSEHCTCLLYTYTFHNKGKY